MSSSALGLERQVRNGYILKSLNPYEMILFLKIGGERPETIDYFKIDG